MMSMLTSLAIFAYFFTLGAATFALIRPSMSPERIALLCPATGLAVAVLTILPLNQLGLPILSFGTAYAAITISTAIGILLTRIGPIKMGLPCCWPFAPPILLSLVLTGRPFLDYGFYWLSFSNDDMANYAMSAGKVLHFGYYQIPTISDILYGNDARQFFWFPLELRAERVGSELLLGLSSSVCHLSMFYVFMPLILALQLSLICSAASLALTSTTSKYAVFAAYLLSASALVSLGTLSQLIAQVLGLLFLASAASLTAAPVTTSRSEVARLALILGILFAADGITYPETLPFLVCAVGASLTIQVLRRERSLKSVASLVAITSAGFLIALNHNLVISFSVLLTRVEATQIAVDPRYSSYPYYLVPSGLANFWGFIPYPVAIADPLESAAIAAGGILLVAAFCLALRESYYGRAAGIISAMMLLFAILLYHGQKGFGLYKLAMYAAPFVIATLSVSLSTLRYRSFLATLIAIVTAAGAVSQFYYVERSRDLAQASESGFVEVRNASRSHVLEELDSIQASARRSGVSVFSDAGLGTLGKYETASFIGTNFISVNHFMEDLLGPDVGLRDLGAPSARQRQLDVRYATKVLEDLKAAEPLRRFDLKTMGETDQFASDLRSPVSCVREFYVACAQPNKFLYVFQSSEHTVVNRLRTGNISRNFLVLPATETANMLVPITSKLAPLLSAANSQALEPLESDYFFRDSTFASINRYLLLEVVRPFDHPRLVLEITDSLNNDGENRLPPFTVIGGRTVSLGLTGRGSARIVSPILYPQYIDRAPLIELDSNSKPFQFRPIRHGLMRMYGNAVVIDSRELVGFARNISLLSNSAYLKLRRPSKIGRFPSDLRNPGLEYSGLYEDGWISEDSFFVLHSSRGASTFRLVGTIPRISDEIPVQALKIFIDRKQVFSWQGNSGPFSISIDHVPVGDHKVSLLFSTTQRLPGDDKRPVSAKIQFVGFVSRGTSPGPLSDTTSGDTNAAFCDGLFASVNTCKAAHPKR